MSKSIEDLVNNYIKNITEYSNEDYNETEARTEFIDPFFELLGWDVYNRRNLSRRFREVSREMGLRIGAQEKRPDYEFRLSAERKFFVEAKKPYVDISTVSDPAFQIRRYGWSAGLKISVLTNFEYLALYDTTIEPSRDHPASHSRLYLFHYSDYLTKFDEIAKLLSRDSVYSGIFDEQFLTQTRNRPYETIDAVFLGQLNQWRLRLCEDILSRKPDLDEQVLNEVSQLFVLRILFLRMCEDRGITNYERLKRTAQTNDWDAFVNLLNEADKQFDSGLFDRNNDPFSSSSRENIRLDSSTVQFIVDSLYFPVAPYTFSVFEPEFLGSVYEQFLTERVSATNGIARLMRKSEYVKRDIIATPRSIIERIVQDTVYPTLQKLEYAKILQKTVLDPACGSGGFLIAAFDVFMDVAATACLKAGDYRAIYESIDGWQLTFEQKCKLLTSCIYGVDRDYAATEVTKFSLLVKLLENETPNSLPRSNSILPSLSGNIAFGDTLVDERVFKDSSSPITIGPPLIWGQNIPQKFDYVVGNPPYLKTEAMIKLEAVEHNFYKKHYRSAYRQFDKYYIFLERVITDLLTPDGFLGMIVSSKFLHVESAKQLRHLLAKEAHITYMIDFGNTQLFESRTTYTCILYLSKVRSPLVNKNDALHYEVVTRPKEWISQQNTTNSYMSVPRYLVSSDSAWLLPNTFHELRLLEALYKDSIPLGEIFDVYNGIQTSANDVYVIANWGAYDNSTLAFNKLEQTWYIEKEVVKPFFDEDKDSLVSFYPLPSTAYIIFPYFVKAGNKKSQAVVIPPTVLQSKFPLAYKWLLYNQSRLEKRDIRPKLYPADEWYRYGRDQALTAFENRPKIIVGVNSQGDKYVYDDSNTLLASGNTAGECAIAAFHEEAGKSIYDLHFALAVLNHKAIEYFCRKRGSPFRGGWYSRGTSVLKQIPLPKVDLITNNNKRVLYESVVQKCKQLREVCRLLSMTTSSADHVRLDRQKTYLKHSMDADISSLYGISSIIDSVELPK